ncbi:MAG: metallophosphoesterase [Bacteroidales bacterium]
MNSFLNLKVLCTAAAALMVVACTQKAVSDKEQPFVVDSQITSIEDNFNLYVVSDLGRNGYYLQKPIAHLMGEMADVVSPEYILAAGDTHHFEGVRSTQDPLWMTNFEAIYSHPELMIDWYAICGNHEYRGNTQAVLDYTAISRRWNAPSRYYTFASEVNDSTDLRVIMIDTTPLIQKYQKSKSKYPDVQLADNAHQIAWLDSVLQSSTEKWKIVVGHHPIYSHDKKHGGSEDLLALVDPLMQKYGVNAYLAGHIHNFQHIKPENSKVNYYVNSSASLSRPSMSGEGTKFHSSDAGFTIVSATTDNLSMIFVNQDGKQIYRSDLN